MKVFFVCTWFPNRNNLYEGTFLKNAAAAISTFDQVTTFFAEEDKHISGKAIEESRKDGSVEIRIIYYKAFGSPSRWLNMLVSSIRRIYYLNVMIKKELTIARPDIFHFNIVSPSMVLMWYYKIIYRIPFVYSEHWDVPLRASKGLQKRWLSWRIGMTLCSVFASRVIVCSKAVKDSFMQYRLSSRIEIIPCVVVADNKNIRDELRLQENKILLHVSGLSDPQKNITGMLDALGEIGTHEAGFALHLLGQGKEFQHHKAHAAKLGILDKTVYFHGAVTDEEKWSWFEKSICHVLFSNFEGYSVVTAESIYFGRPVIVTRCGGPEDFVTENCGIMIEPGDIGALKTAILNMVEHFTKFDPVTLRKYGEEVFSPAIVGMKHNQLYRDITGIKE